MGSKTARTQRLLHKSALDQNLWSLGTKNQSSTGTRYIIKPIFWLHGSIAAEFHFAKRLSGLLDDGVDKLARAL